MKQQEIERGQGLITRILQREAPKKLDQPFYRMNPALLKTQSDFEYAKTLDRLANKQQRGTLNRKEARELRHALKILQERGKLTLVTHEDE